MQEVSGATKGVLIVAGVSAAVLVLLLGTLVWRAISAVLSLLPKSSGKKAGKGSKAGKGAAANGSVLAAAAATPLPGAAGGPRGPDLKALIRDQQKAGTKKTTPKDEQASHHPLFLNTLKGHGDVVHSVAWNADGTQLATACEDMMVRLWELLDVTSREPKHRRVKAAKSPLGATWGDAPDSVVVLMRGAPDAQVAGYAPGAAGKDGAGQYEQQWLVQGVHGKGVPLAMRGSAGGAPGRKAVSVSLSDAKEAKLFNAQGRELAVLEPNSLRNHNLAVSLDGRFVAVAGFTAEVKLWEVKWARDTGAFMGAPKVMELKGHKSQVQCVALSPDNKRAVTASKDGTLRVWNIDVRYAQQEDPKTLLVISQPLAGGRLYQHLAYGPTGVIAASHEGLVHLLSASTGELLDVIDAHDGAITSMQWCPRLVKTPGAAEPHGVLATSSRDKRVRLWRAP